MNQSTLTLKIGARLRRGLPLLLAMTFFPWSAGARLPELVPAPREVKWSQEAPAILAPDAVAIVIGAKARPPEEEAARLLQEYVAKRFHRQWPIVREGTQTKEQRTLFVLGERDTCQLVDRICRDRGIELSGATPGPDGYVITSASDGDRFTVVVGGSNPRGVIYGQDTLSQMLQAADGKLTLARAEVRDAPVIPWRGRPQTDVVHYLRAGELDLYARARINFIDLRSGIYAFEPGEKLDHAQIAEAIQGAHRRGIVVFATVNCGVPKKAHDLALGTFREMLDLGADGLWLSFDDKGPGEDPVGLVTRVLDLGRQRGIAGHLIGITPPKGSYPKIVTEFNRTIMALRGMEQAMWLWTAVPDKEAFEAARSIGLKAGLGWWHNWPRIFTAQKYVGIPPLSLGWSEPQYEGLADAGNYLEFVMPWGGNNLGRYYVAPVIGWWAWNPKAHDWNALRRRISSLVFGEANADDAVVVDDALQQLSNRFEYSHKSTPEHPPGPPRLRRPSDRAPARALLDRVRPLMDRLAGEAPATTFLAADELMKDYVDPLRATVASLACATEATFPEEWFPERQAGILGAIGVGNRAAAELAIGGARERVQKELAAIQAGFPRSPRIDDYVKWWQTRSTLDVAGWNELLAKQQKSLDGRVAEYARIVPTATMIEGLRTPPLEWGIGRWQVSNRLLAMALPAAHPQFWGDWAAGVVHEHGIDAAVFAASKKVPGEPGEFAELPARIPVSGRRDRLGVLLFASSTNKDKFSNTMIPYRWAGYRFIQLLWGDQVLWEQDLGCLPETGQWFMIRLPRLPPELKDLPLRLRVEDRKVSLNNYTICFVGPLRLMELPGDPSAP